MNAKWIFIVGLCSLVLKQNKLYSQSFSLPDNADSAFLILEEALSPRYPKGLDSIRPGEPEYLAAEHQISVAMESAAMNYRVLGMEFWNKFPNDNRKCIWFVKTLQQGGKRVHYWNNIEIGFKRYLCRENFLSSYDAELDHELLNEWEEMYPIIRKEYLRLARLNNYRDFTFSMRERDLCREEMATFFNLSRNISYRNGTNLNLDEVKNLILDKMKRIGSNNSFEERDFLKVINSNLLSGYKYLGLNEDSIFNLLDRLRQVKDISPAVIEWIDQTGSLMQLFRSEIDFRFTLPNGEEFKLQEWRSPESILLIDIWALSCSSCIGRMSYLKKLYEKYSGRGFAILSICAVDEKDRHKVDSIKASLKTDWKNLIIGSPVKGRSNVATELWKKYGFLFVPHMFLVDRSGKAVLYNHELVEGEFEPYLRELLAKGIIGN